MRKFLKKNNSDTKCTNKLKIEFTLFKAIFLLFFFCKVPTSFSQKIAAGGNHSLYICNNGNSANSWGYNNDGQLGNGNTTSRSRPVLINDLTGIKAIAAGNQHTLVLKKDSTVWAWGDNTYGQLGDGTTIAKITPTKISTLSSIIAISSGRSGHHSIALKKDGSVWTWGDNANGQLGDGTYVSKSDPTQITTLSNIIKIVGGQYHTLALKNDGTVWAWGRNANGQLGNGTYLSKTIPTQVSSITNVVAIAAGESHSIALKNDGTVWTWGKNNVGQLGIGNTVDRLTPVQVTSLTSITAIYGGSSHSLAIKSDSTMVAWGANIQGQLGNGTYTHSLTPTIVSSLTKVVEIAAGFLHTLAMDVNGSVFSFGDNGMGQLGNGSTLRNVPTLVTSLCVDCSSNANLTVTESASGVILTAATNNSYKWVDCNNNYSVISGASNQEYTVPANGSYAVIIYTTTCQDTSACYAVNTVGLENTLTNTSSSTISVYPNPTNGIFTVLVANEIDDNSTLEIHNLLGEKINNSITLVKEEKRIIDLTSQPNGVYYISVKSGNEIYYQKFIKQ